MALKQVQLVPVQHQQGQVSAATLMLSLALTLSIAMKVTKGPSEDQGLGKVIDRLFRQYNKGPNSIDQTASLPTRGGFFV